jgi:subtilase family serine protease
MPPWQQSFLSRTQSTLNGGKRAVPDVAADADFQNSPFAAYYKQHWVMEGGTSLSAPLWAGIVALTAQAVSQQKGKTLASAMIAAYPGGGGFNAMLYAAKTAAGAAAFHDVVSGSDELDGYANCDLCSTGAGFNDVTGLGAPNVSGLINQIVSQVTQVK